MQKFNRMYNNLKLVLHEIQAGYKTKQGQTLTICTIICNIKDITEEKTDNYFFSFCKTRQIYTSFFSPPGRSLHFHLKKASFPT